MTTVCVVGAGIVGCATAYQLVRSGFDVHLVDAAEAPGTGTSFANGAQLSYSYVEPFASPATLRALPRMLLSRSSAVKFRLRADPHQWAWGLKFLSACRTRRTQQGTAHLLALAQRSRHVLNEWLAEEAWSVDFSQNGKLVLCPDSATLRRQAEQVALQARLGCQQEILSPAQCLMKEPALRLNPSDFAGGIWTADECVADPHLLCKAMVRSLLDRGGTASFETKVSGFVRKGHRFVAARTAQQDIAADAFVLAVGPHAPTLAATFGLRLPIYPIKGYSITLPFDTDAMPTASVTDLGRKTVFAPLGGRLRVASSVEIGGYGLGIPAARIASMLEGVNALYPGLCDTARPEQWAGLRPSTPDSLPIIGRHGATNMFLNVGQGALGLTLAAGSASLVASTIAIS